MGVTLLRACANPADAPWPKGVVAAMSDREGGVSQRPFDHMNLGSHVGDDPVAVHQNRVRWARRLGVEPVYLEQVHGVHVHQLKRAALCEDLERPPVADAAVTLEGGVACTVMVADCLPVLLASGDGSVVAAAHAGWRGLAAGVLEHTLAAMAHCAGRPCAETVAWLGPCIGPGAFEVGGDVLKAFEVDKDLFQPAGEGKFLADLPGLALRRLQRAGIKRLAVADQCTVSNPERWFSYRRDRVTGRQAASIWRP